MDLSKEEEKKLVRLIRLKVAEKGGVAEITEDDKHDIAATFLKDRKQESNDDEILSAHAKEIHTSNIIRINKLIDKIEKGIYSGGFDQLMPSVGTEGLKENRWDFHLGCKVVVDMPKERFKFLQEKTLGWAKRLRNVIGQYGYVTNVKNEFDSKLVVYFPEIFTSTMLYAGVLSKTDEDFHVTTSRWKVGDYVRTTKGKTLIKKFQKRLPDLPDKTMGKQGRVIAVTNAGVFVTFNETSSYSVNPAILREVENPVPMVKQPITDHPKGFRVGMDVMVISNFKTLIDNQKDFGGWNWKMSSMAGKLVTIAHIKSDASLIVRMKVGRTWRLNYESAYLQSDSCYEDRTANHDLPFTPGDVVRLRITSSIKVQLVAAKVLESCLDFLKLPGKVEGVDDDFDVVVRFTNGKKRVLNPRLIQKVSASQLLRFHLNEDRNLSLKAGDMVRIYTGPPRYVNESCSNMKIKTDSYKAFTEEAELMGYVDYQHAVIRYEDSRSIKINRKYLVSAKQAMWDIPKKIDFNNLKSLVQTVESCIAILNVQEDCRDLDGSVDVFSVTTGSPPTLSLRINSPNATPGNVITCLKDLNTWDIISGCENECTVKMEDGMEVDIVLLGQDEMKTGEQMKQLPEPDEETKVRPSSDAQKQRENVKVVKSTPVVPEVASGVEVADDPGQPSATSVQGHQAFRYATVVLEGRSIQIPFRTPTTRPTTGATDSRTGPNYTNIIYQGANSRAIFNSNN